ncbi:heparan sulfate glucosamine 3-O-sulfotransferase 1-like [Asterias rubens]|uniref:heparan sulfate glucosamine 3-O-sulfotransferase 1-like n=1 Tax=Asterias rubens TaxID=7604 RepID=UPI00145568BD|nr:heparan sulfate glucosamine 3-O-sulfotransferase 1-like [Asterias rubens]
MAATWSKKQKAFLLLLAVFLMLTIVGRLSYSKQFHGLLCAARTFHHFVTSDTNGPVIPNENEDGVTFWTENGKPKKSMPRKISGAKAENIQRQIKMKKASKPPKPSKEIRIELATGGKAQRLPQAIIIGVRKCGTRALLEMLETHPQIAACGPEVHFFDKNYKKGLQWYQNQMKPSTPDQITIEKTPGYIIAPEVPELVYKMNKNTKLLVIVREPTTRVISDYTQLKEKSTSWLSKATFESAVLDGNQIRSSYKAVQISIYVKHVLNWLKYFPLSQMHFVDGDKLISNPLPELKAVEKFLGMRDVISSDMIYFNATRGFYCMASEFNTKCLNSNKGREHPYVSPELMKKLQDYFRPYNEKFFKTINQRFDWP